MSHACRRRVVVLLDSGDPTWSPLAGLPPPEQDLIDRLPTAKERRQSALARVAGHMAIEGLGMPVRADACIQILKSDRGQPLVRVDGQTGEFRVSLAHSSLVAAAVAWKNGRCGDYAAAVDLERVRPTEVASSSYAFSRIERAVIRKAPGDRSLGGLSAWSSKEAAWKTLQSDPNWGPETVELEVLDLCEGHAVVRPAGGARSQDGKPAIHVRLVLLNGPDGSYILALAERGICYHPSIKFGTFQCEEILTLDRIGGRIANGTR